MTLHEELNKKTRNPNIYSNNFKLDQSNQNLMLSNFIQEFINNNASIISDLFYYTNQTIIQCSNCGIKKFNYQINSYLQFPLEEIKKHKQNQFINNNNNIITIYDCFLYNQRIEFLTGENALPCEYCNLISNSNYMSMIYSPPEIFILILDKPILSQIKLEFYEEINLSQFILANNFGSMYRLFGVVAENTTGINKHFIAYCKSPINYCWYKYDNDFVYLVNNFKNEIIDSSEPYVLFYQKTV